MSKHEKESEPKKTEKGFSTALLLNLSPSEGINEGIDNVKLNTSASAAQDSTTKIKDFLSKDLLEKIEAESPLVKLQEKNNNKLNENILDLGNNDINLVNSSLNSSVDDSEDEEEEFENENNKNKIKQNLNPILNEMVKNNQMNENNINENNSNIIKNNYYIPQQNINLNNENYSDYTNKNLYSYYGSTSQYLSRHMNNNNNPININENNIDFQMNKNNNNDYMNNSELIKKINEMNNQQKLLYEYKKLQEMQKIREKQEIINNNNNIFYQNSLPLNFSYQNKKKEENEIKSNKIKLDKNGKPYKEEDYIIEMFGRVGWICDQCNNFNYDTRNKCNRCGIPKSPKKISKMKRKNELKRQEEQEKLKLQNQIKNKNQKIKERRGDWICAKCGNLNFSFRLVCNRCQLVKTQSDFISQRINFFNNQNFQMGNFNNGNFNNNLNSQFQFVNNGPFYFNNMNIIQFNNNQNLNEEEN
jgi:hypothetical protein